MSRLTTASTSVTEALQSRFSCRAFLDTPVPESDVKYLIETATRAPSGGNLQPWHMWAVQGEALKEFVADIKTKMADKPGGEGSEYHIYPPELKQPYDTRRRDIGMKHSALRAKISLAEWVKWRGILNFLARPVRCFSRSIKPCKKANGQTWV
jgi:nitroreductase